MDGWAELEAFVAECGAAEATLGEAPADSASWPAIGDWSLGRLVGHLVGVVERAGKRLSQPPPDVDRAEIDRAGYYVRHMAVEESGAFAPTEDPELTDPTGWAERFAQAWRATQAAVAGSDPAALVETRYGTMAVGEFLATRVLEVCVHHLDVRMTIGLPPSPTPEAGKITQDILERLLDGPRPRNLGRTRFIRAATGRGGYDDPRFPVLR